MDSPPVPSALVKSPPWSIKSLITRWKMAPLKCNGFPKRPLPFSPVHKQRKFSAVLNRIYSRCKQFSEGHMFKTKRKQYIRQQKPWSGLGEEFHRDTTSRLATNGNVKENLAFTITSVLLLISVLGISRLLTKHKQKESIPKCKQVHSSESICHITSVALRFFAPANCPQSMILTR